jgi:hypothetical protein
MTLAKRFCVSTSITTCLLLLLLVLLVLLVLLCGLLLVSTKRRLGFVRLG